MLKTPKITELFAFIAVEGPEDEGIIAMMLGDKWMPMLGADMKRMESLRPIAQNIATINGQKVILAKFTTRINIEDIEPSDSPIKEKWK